MAPTTRNQTRARNRSSASDIPGNPTVLDSEGASNVAGTSGNLPITNHSVINGRITRSRTRSVAPSSLAASSQNARAAASTSQSTRATASSSQSSGPSGSRGATSSNGSAQRGGVPKHSAAAYRIARNVLRSFNDAIQASSSASSSVSRLEIGAASSRHQASGFGSDADSVSAFDVHLGPAEEERISQGDFKFIFDFLARIQDRLLYINKRLDQLLERCNMLYIPQDPTVSPPIVESQEIDVASYHSSRLVCSVCYCDLLKPDASPVSTICGHIYCRDCLYKIMIMQDSKCPNCRKPLGVRDQHPVYFPQLLH